MKVFFSENTVDYSTYTFNYTAYCVKEHQSELPDIYNKGFLPYSNNLSLQKDVFYMARSLRVDLPRFESTSENRRVDRQMAHLAPSFELYKKSDLDRTSSGFDNFCKTYIDERIGDDQMSLERFNYIMASPLASHVFVCKSQNKALGYVVACLEGSMLHYWFAFFDTTYMRSHALGKWLMWRTILWAKENQLAHVYLGTAYKPSAFYKIRDHKGLAYFDGACWSQDLEQLKKRCNTDLDPLEQDRFKLLQDPNLFIDQLP
jgi:leucyl-tRNA---protein transferase